ncbi:uncharacterized protein LOC117591125 [Drosophila guanche]|uniref:Blast:Uncharacterized protein C17orf105 homolog n=1 Tax=Drosophila guanche TaxID=7266 RepID=A0A3B0K5T6_DROGU|nr:uncharacterized protein LOC117591125 [Drosophila guanche]SPP89564.1 blast:Uncharacterized protein C17orf105 homolog [Drosophila guanche]
MISRRDKLLQQPWEQLRYAQHREKVLSARPAIDTHTPRCHEHVQRKWKKQQNELERQQQIERENLRLLQKLGDIMRTKRINNVWLEPRPTFLNREKHFPTRPYSSLPEIVTNYGQQPAGTLIYGMLPKHTVVGRCPTCSGNPERTEVAIPEQRTQWAPARNSWNRKTQQPLPHQRCYHCGSYKSSERKLFEEYA